MTLEHTLIDEEFAKAMLEMRDHDSCVGMTEMIYKYGLFKTLLRLSDYCEDAKEAYALEQCAKFYKENERAFCKDAPTMQ